MLLGNLINFLVVDKFWVFLLYINGAQLSLGTVWEMCTLKDFFNVMYLLQQFCTVYTDYGLFLSLKMILMCIYRTLTVCYYVYFIAWLSTFGGPKCCFTFAVQEVLAKHIWWCFFTVAWNKLRYNRWIGRSSTIVWHP